MMKSVLVALWGAVAVQGEDAMAQATAEMNAAMAAISTSAYDIKRWDGEECGEDAAAVTETFITGVCDEMVFAGGKPDGSDGKLQVKVAEGAEGPGHIYLQIAATAADDPEAPTCTDGAGEFGSGTALTAAPLECAVVSPPEGEEGPTFAYKATINEAAGQAHIAAATAAITADFNAKVAAIVAAAGAAAPEAGEHGEDHDDHEGHDHGEHGEHGDDDTCWDECAAAAGGDCKKVAACPTTGCPAQDVQKLRMFVAADCSFPTLAQCMEKTPTCGDDCTGPDPTNCAEMEVAIAGCAKDCDPCHHKFARAGLGCKAPGSKNDVSPAASVLASSGMAAVTIAMAAFLR